MVSPRRSALASGDGGGGRPQPGNGVSSEGGTIRAMKRLDIVHWPAPVLLAPTDRIEAVDDDLRHVIGEMRRVMFSLKGVGIAAPQVGIGRQVMLVCPTGAMGEETVVLNPEILEVSGEDVADEGCLSLPGVYGPVPRATKIRVRHQDLDLRVHERELEGYAARVFQHEHDHLQGTMFIERMRPADRAAIDDELTPFLEAAQRANDVSDGAASDGHDAENPGSGDA